MRKVSALTIPEILPESLKNKKEENFFLCQKCAKEFEELFLFCKDPGIFPEEYFKNRWKEFFLLSPVYSATMAIGKKIRRDSSLLLTTF
ncbi:MAG: hypothetical protein V1851_00980 [Patescibacteria group bacterium]